MHCVLDSAVAVFHSGTGMAGTLPVAVIHGKEGEARFIKAFLRFQRG